MPRYTDVDKLAVFKYPEVSNDKFVVVETTKRSEIEKYLYKLGYNTAIEDVRFAPVADVVEREVYDRLYEKYISTLEELYNVREELECIRFCDHMKGKKGVEHDA